MITNNERMESLRKELQASVLIAQCLGQILGKLQDNLEALDRLENAGPEANPYKEKDKGKEAPASKSHPFQRFRSEGPTLSIVRLLYKRNNGLTVDELRKGNGGEVPDRLVPKIVNRLVHNHCARRKGKKVVLTELGISSWENSPLFAFYQRNAGAGPNGSQSANSHTTH